MLKKIKVSFVANETNFAKPTYDPSYTRVQISDRQQQGLNPGPLAHESDA